MAAVLIGGKGSGMLKLEFNATVVLVRARVPCFMSRVLQSQASGQVNQEFDAFRINIEMFLFRFSRCVLSRV